MLIPRLRKFGWLLVAFGGLLALASESAAVLDLYTFEYSPIARILGYRGMALVLALNAGLLLLTVRAIRRLQGAVVARARTSNWMLATCALLALWVGQYLFMEYPLTARIAKAMSDSARPELDWPHSPDFSGFSLTQKSGDAESRQRLRVMYERIRFNNPEAYRIAPIAATIDKYSKQYDVDTDLLFYLNYIDSFYGEAASGPVPFLHSMTSESIRDLVQVHLPGWFVESTTRRKLISSTIIPRLAGDSLGFKLRYAIHKSTLDVSLHPYALNTFSDIFLVFREFPDEFPEFLSGNAPDPVIAALRESFGRLRDSALLAPYEFPYTQPEYTAAHYDRYRDDYKKFSRAAYYLMQRDFDLATRTQALLSRYQAAYYARNLGQERWDSLPSWQQAAMLAMIRDLYSPNVGHIGYNLYALPELNCTPLEFVRSEAVAASQASLGPDQTGAWRPPNYQYLWGGAGFRLRVLSEVWNLINNSQLPGLPPTDTAAAAYEVLSRELGE